MPIYLYQHPETEEVIELVQKMNEEHSYTDNKGVRWKRIFTVPGTAIDSTNIDPFSQADFMKATNKKGMTFGEMTDLYKNLHKQREKKAGIDPVKNKVVTSYEKKTRKPHPNKGK